MQEDLSFANIFRTLELKNSVQVIEKMALMFRAVFMPWLVQKVTIQNNAIHDATYVSFMGYFLHTVKYRQYKIEMPDKLYDIFKTGGKQIYPSWQYVTFLSNSEMCCVANY